MKFLSKSLFGETTWFCVVHPNLNPTLGVAMGVEGGLLWELRVGSGPLCISYRKLKISISHDVVILASQSDAMLRPRNMPE